ncbi:peptidoglycan-binding domain-containing protein [Streptomyces sp. NPDC012935]|uniref:peptidoglycan-binding domain-containing protein n=1 Tax=Streptomyces sp. NPDC012935 TaxID=3364857 RepID=UPI00367EF79D
MTEPTGAKGPDSQDGPIGQNGHLCPECGTPRGADNTPSCGCGLRVSEALRDARTAEAAAAEDFDPLRIRPYVELEGTGEAVGETMPLRAVPVSPPTPLAPPATTPSAQDLSLFEPDGVSDRSDPADDPGTATTRRRRTRTVLLGAGGALVAVFTAAGLASGMFTYEAPVRDTALPDDVRASVPAPATSEARETPSPTVPSTQSAAPPASPTPTQSASASPSPSRASASPSASAPPEPTNAPSTTEAAGSQEDSAAARDPGPATLQRGDRGPEVTELELRLTQLGLYTREARGNYNEAVEDAVIRYQWARGVQPDEYGVYDLATRERLESETTEP